MPLPREHLLDELSTAYVQAVCARAGAVIAVTRLDYGVDGTIRHILRADDGRFADAGLAVDFQLKGTTVAEFDNVHVEYVLRSRNYNLILVRE